MQAKTDAELLREYAIDQSEAAFGEIVRRYADFVYSAALRQVNDPEQARDVAQVVFTDLARKAGSLRANTLLIGWLCHGARLAALEQLRNQRRRLHRERQAMELLDISLENPGDWNAVRPALDEALARLGAEDRDALLLRFFKNESLASVGATLGISEDAAQKRVSRALGKLREFLAERGITTTAAALSVALAANAVHAAPAGFAAALTAAALAKAAAGTASVSLLKLLTTTPMKTAILSIVLGGAVAGLTVQQIKTQHQLRDAQTTVQQQAGDLQSLRAANEQLVTQSSEIERLRADAQDVPRLRGEVAQLRQQQAAMKTAATGQMASGGDNQPAPPKLAVGLVTKFVVMPTGSLKSLNLAWTPGADGTATALLSDEQFKDINEALNGATDVKILAGPRVTTSIGGEAKISVSQSGSSAMTRSSGGVTSRSGSFVGGGGGGGGGSFGGSGAIPAEMMNPASFGAFPGTNASAGVTLDITPDYSTNSSTFDLQITAESRQWVDKSPQQDGSQKEMQTAEAKTRATLSAGQTVVLLKDVPSETLESTAAPAGPRAMLVFVTPSVVRVSERLTSIVHKAESNVQLPPPDGN